MKGIGLGNILTIIIIIGSMFVFFLSYHDRLTLVESAQASNERRETAFQQYVREALSEIRQDVRELRNK
jgi:cell division protein FtsL